MLENKGIKDIQMNFASTFYLYSSHSCLTEINQQELLNITVLNIFLARITNNKYLSKDWD